MKEKEVFEGLGQVKGRSVHLDKEEDGTPIPHISTKKSSNSVT